jgi:hypothetical protein
MAKSLYDQVVEITAKYLGPTADRFVTRQVELKLGKRPDQLVKSDLESLSTWINASIGLLTKDQAVLKECAAQLQSLGNGNGHRKRVRK